MTFRKVISDYVYDGLDYLTHRVGNYTSNKFDEFAIKIEHKVMGLQDRMVRKLTSGLLFSTSVVFIALSGFYFLREYVNLSNTTSFFSIGVVLLMVGLIIKSTERRY